MRFLIFDSGIGGLPTALALRRLRPDDELVYLADTAGFPYGEQSDASLTAAILRVVGEAVDVLRPDLVVVACNTASTVALDALRGRFALPFVGCVPPIKWAATISRTRVIGLLATPATVRRPYLQALIRDFAGGCRVLSHGAPHLARLAEDRFHGRPVDETVLRAELGGLTSQPDGERIDTVALGCTHYLGLLPALRPLLPSHIVWLDPAEPVARQSELVASGLRPGGGPSLDGTAAFTGAMPTDDAARRWASAGFPRLRQLLPGSMPVR